MPGSADSHFRTEHLTKNVGQRVVRGAAVTVASQVLRFILQTGSTIVLARLLTPRDFGLYGMVAVVMGLVGLFKDLGLSAATIQKVELTHEQVSTLFWINVVLSACSAAAVAVLAPVVAWVYGEPGLTWMVVALSGTFLLGGLTAQHHALLRRQMRFGEIATAEVTAIVASAVASITSALAGAGHWALVIGGSVHSATMMVVIWYSSGWCPSRPSRNNGLRSMLAFGGNLTAYDMLSYLALNADQMLIGAYWGAGPLGLYSKAYGLVMLPLHQLRTPITQVAVPALCRLQHDPRQFRSFYLKVLTLIAFITLPIGAAAAMGTDEVIRLVLGEQWRDAGTIFRALALSLPLQAMLGCVGWLFIATGRASEMLRWGLFACGAVLASFLIGLPFGPVGVAASYSLMNVVIAWPVSAWGVRGTPVTTADFWGTMPKALIATAAATLLALVARAAVMASGGNEWAGLAAAWVTLGAAYLLVILYVLGMKEGLADLLTNLRRRQDPGEVPVRVA